METSATIEVSNCTAAVPNGRQKLLCLEGLRGLCALAVLCSHLIYHDLVYPHFSIWPLLGGMAHIAVLVFFILSGFVIGYSTPSECDSKSIVRYLKKRAFRILPIYLVWMAVTFLVLYRNQPWQTVVGHALFLQGWWVETLQGNGIVWSLHYEVLFYLLFIPVWKFKVRPSWIIALAALAAILLPVFPNHPLRILAYFGFWAAGLELAKLYRERSTHDLRPAKDLFWPTMFALAAYCQMNLVHILLKKAGTDEFGKMPTLPSATEDMVVLPLVAALVAAPLGLKVRFHLVSLIAAIAFTLVPIGYAFNKHIFGTLMCYPNALSFLMLGTMAFLFQWRVPLFERWHWWGSISYALYLIHMPVLLLMLRELGPSSGKVELILSRLAAAMLAVLFAYLLDVWMQNALRNFFFPAKARA